MFWHAVMALVQDYSNPDRHRGHSRKKATWVVKPENRAVLLQAFSKGQISVVDEEFVMAF